MKQPQPKEKMVIYGEGIPHPAFMGSVYMRDNGESMEKADWRFGKAMESMGFEWLGAKK